MKKNLRQDKIRIVVGINSLTSSQYPAYSNHLQVFYRLGRCYPDIDFCLVNPCRMSIDRMRNMAAEIAMDIEAKYLLFLDDDVIVPAPFDFLTKLMALDADITAGDVIIRGYPFDHMLFRHPGGKKERGLKTLARLPKQRGPYPVDAVGFSLALIKVELLKKMSLPFFITGLRNTEDVYFCLKAREEHPETTIMADTSIMCGHILWPEIMDSLNKKNYKKYYELQFGKGQQDEEAENRGEKYLRSTKKVLHVE